MRSRHVIAFALCLLLLPCLGGLGGFWLFTASQEGALARWRALPAPPQPAAALVTADLNSVTVRAADGTLHQCPHRGAEDRPACWTAVAEPPRPDDDLRFDEPQFAAPPPRGTPVDTLTVTADYADAVYDAHYALMPDGRVWLWEHGVGAYLALGLMVFFPLLCGGLAGVLGLGVFLVLLFRWRRPPSLRTRPARL